MGLLHLCTAAFARKRKLGAHMQERAAELLHARVRQATYDETAIVNLVECPSHAAGQSNVRQEGH